MPKISADASAARRDHILKSARTCFLKHGLTLASVDQICAEAGVSKGAFYGYFKSKEALISAIVEDQESVFDQLRTVATLAELQERLVPVLAPSGVGRLEVEAWAYALRDPQFHARIARNSEVVLEGIKAALEKLGGSGAVDLKVPARMGAAVLQTFLMGAIARDAVASDNWPFAKGLDVIMSSIAEDAARKC